MAEALRHPQCHRVHVPKYDCDTCLLLILIELLTQRPPKKSPLMPRVRKARAPREQHAPGPDPLGALPDILRVAQQVKHDPRRFAGYASDPVGFAADVLGVQNLWAKQVEVLEAIRDFGWSAVKSGNGGGKTFVLAIAVLWWVYAVQGNAITTSQTWEQTERVLWGQIGKLWRAAPVPLPGELLLTELRIEPGWGAVGLNAESPVAFQGRHDPKQLVVVDEAMGIEELVWDAIISLVTGEDNKLCAIGNPTEATGTFYEAHRSPDWHSVTISCLDHPNVVAGENRIPGAVTRKWVEQQRRRYGEGTAGWLAHVIGEFPLAGSNQLIALHLCEQAQAPATTATLRQHAVQHKSPVTFAVDVARYGSNRSVVAVRRGGVIEQLEERQGMSAPELEGLVASMARTWEPEAILVDEPGIGGPVIDHLLLLGLPVIGFQPGGRASNPRQFKNLRSECWWRLREWLQDGRLALPRHAPLVKELTEQLYRFTPTGQVFVTPKAELDAPSPDFGDAVMMSLALELPDPEEPAVDPDDTTRDPAIIGQGGGDPSWDDPADALMGGVYLGYHERITRVGSIFGWTDCAEGTPVVPVTVAWPHARRT